jgi:nucleotide-binding universal stress UspA family protein
MSKALILVTTDFSPESERAFPTAVALATAMGAELRLLHAVAEIAPVATQSLPTPGAADDPNVPRARERLKALAAKVAGAPAVTSAVVAGTDVDAAITRYAKEQGAAFLVVASHGRSGVRRLVVGSVAERILRTSKVPVVIVPIGNLAP